MYCVICEYQRICYWIKTFIQMMVKVWTFTMTDASNLAFTFKNWWDRDPEKTKKGWLFLRMKGMQQLFSLLWIFSRCQQTTVAAHLSHFHPGCLWIENRVCNRLWIESQTDLCRAHLRLPCWGNCRETLEFWFRSAGCLFPHPLWDCTSPPTRARSLRLRFKSFSLHLPFHRSCFFFVGMWL